MMISTKGRYALRVMIDLAEHSKDGFIPMKAIAERQNISLKYLEKIVPPLAKNNLIVGVHGKGGGYKLTESPESYKVGDILRVTEGDLAPVACLECDSQTCPLTDDCRTRPMWNKLYGVINEYLDSVTIADLMLTDDKQSQLGE